MLTSITTESQTNGVQQQENEDIFNAAESGNIDKIRAFLAQGVDINSQSDNGTLLHIAAMKPLSILLRMASMSIKRDIGMLHIVIEIIPNLKKSFERHGISR